MTDEKPVAPEIQNEVVSEMRKYVQEILEKREAIKENFFKAFLAASLKMDENDVPNEEKLDYIIKNVKLVETVSGHTTSWHFEMRNAIKIVRASVPSGFDSEGRY